MENQEVSRKSSNQERENWEDIHKDFSEHYRQKWEDLSFSYQEAQKWVEAGFKPEDFYKVGWWKGHGFDSQSTKSLIELGFKHNESRSAKQWKNQGFEYQEVAEWIKFGLKPQDAEFANYLREKEYNLRASLNLEELRREFSDQWNDKSAQEYLDFFYPQEERNNVKEVVIINKRIIGKLDLSDFVNLEKLICWNNQLTDLNLNNCLNLKDLNCRSNQLTKLDLTNLSKLKIFDSHNNYLQSLNLPFHAERLNILDIRNNNFPEQDLSMFEKLVNLEGLFIGNNNQKRINQGIYNRFYGSLKPLQELTKLEWLNIKNTDIDNGWEYLSDDIRNFFCSADLRKDAKVKAIEEDWNHFNQDLKKCKEFNGTTRKWLDENYSEDKRKKTIELDISYEKISKEKEGKKIKLNGGLRLKGFSNLEKLNCSGHQFTNLDLNDCSSLNELKCNNNEIKNLDFLKSLTKLEKFWVQNNQKLSNKNLLFLTPFINLKLLDISDCSLKGSLKPFRDLNSLEWLDISNTDIKEGLEYLPKSCKSFYCELDYQYGSVKIAKELSKFSEGIDEKSGHTKYSLDNWRIDQANYAIASIISLERLFVIRGNLKQFINKWGKKTEDDWFDKNFFIKRTKEETNNLNELSKLQSPNNPNELQKDRWAIYSTQAFGRSAAILGTVLTFQDQSAIGGGILGAYPFAELLVSKLDERLKDKENKWKEFLSNADNFLDNYHELLAVTKSIKINELGKINKIFRNLKEKVNEFLKNYDKDGNEEIDLEELITKRKELSLSLNDKESKLWEIVNIIKQLEDKVTNYRQGINIEEIEESQQLNQVEEETEISQADALNQSQQNLLSKSEHEAIELEQIEQQVLQIQPTYGTPGSSGGRGNN